MKKKFLLVLSMVALAACLFAVSVSAAATNEFGTPEAIEGIDLKGMNTDMSARVVILRADGEYYTYPSGYVVKDSTTFCFDFAPISNALGEDITKASVIRIEIPNNILVMPSYGATTVTQSSTLRQIKFLPDSQLTTLGYGCFFSNTALEKLNIPKNVTSISTLVVNNSYIEEIVFEDGFSAHIPESSFKGVKGLKRMYFSNQMTTIADRAFDSTLGEQLEELYIGKGLKDLGTNNMAYAKRSLKIYAYETFLSELEAIERSTFTWWDGSSLPKGVVFFTGSYEQVQALVEKSTSNSIIFANPTVVEWDPTKADDDYMPTGNSWTVVYNYNVCKACYRGQHVLTGKENANVKDFLSEITVGDICTRQGCGMGTVTETIAPIFECLGTAVSEFTDVNGNYSITIGYKINKTAYASYLEYGELEYGFVASASSAPLTCENGKVSIKDGVKAICAEGKKLIHDYADIKLLGVGTDKNGVELTMSMYVYDGKSIAYLSEPLIINVGE